MPDDFYNGYDREIFSNGSNSPRKQDYRDVFHQDRDRLMFTPSFRRLQTKTQVFQAGEYDFYRTRLTHSLEVSRIADSVSVWLRTQYPDVTINHHLLEAICLAHDIGHPPFGHAGERVLNDVMSKLGGFEGNAQTLRILTSTIYSGKGKRTGMSPSRALLDGILKYKELYRDSEEKKNHFIYDDQAEILEFCFGEGSLKEKLGPKNVNDFQSIECQIMDLADDIAYSCFDILDGVKARFITRDKIEAWCDTNSATIDGPQRKYAVELIEMIKNSSLQPKMNVIIGELIQTAALVPEKNVLTAKTRRHAYTLTRRSDAEARIKLHKRLAQDLVYRSGALHQIEFKGGKILRGLWDALHGNYFAPGTKPMVLVPQDVHAAFLATDDKSAKARLLCDHLSGMTDAYALRSYKRLLDPDYGSISELI